MSSRNPLSPSFRRSMLFRLLASAGVPAAALGACGGIAVIDNQGEGGAASASQASSAEASSSSNQSSSATGGFECNVPLPEYGSLAYSCMAPSNGSCLPATDFQVMDHFWGQFAEACDDPDSCWCFGAACGCYIQPIEVPCGPEEINNECCYFAIMRPEESFCEGRPFMVAGEARVARACERGDWLCLLSDEPLADEPLSAEDRAALSQHWLRAALNEHASVASFARFVMELIAVGAPADLVEQAQLAIGDEVRHAQLCFALASRYSGDKVGPAAFPAAGQEAPRFVLAEVAVAVAEEGCVNETLAALCAQAALAEAEDSIVKETLAQIANDELRHSDLAWRFVAWACRHDEEARAEVSQAFERSIALVVAGLDSASADAPGAAARAHGMLAESTRRKVMRDALRDLIEPCAAALLDTATVMPAVQGGALNEEPATKANEA